MALTRRTENVTWKAYIPKIALVSYIVFSALFILWTLFSMLKIGVYQAGYNKALIDVSSQSLVQESCQSGIGLPTADGKTATLINVACLQKTDNSEQTPESSAQ